MTQPEFLSAITAVGAITLDDFADVGLPAWEFARWKVDRFAWLLKAGDAEQAAVWRIIERRTEGESQ